MTNHTAFKNAPIREAVIDIRLDSELQNDEIIRFGDIRFDGYDTLKPISEHHVGFHVNASGQSGINQSAPCIVGYRYEDQERGFVAQFQIGGFTLSKMQPYTNWDEFKAEAFRLWNIYKGAVPRIAFSRAAVRYVNEINLPLNEGVVDYDEYLVNGPKLPHNMGSEVNTFFNRIILPVKEIGAEAVIIQAFEKFKDNRAPVILDIDVYREKIHSFSENDVWEYFGKLRDIKNQAFFGSIKDKTKELFK